MWLKLVLCAAVIAFGTLVGFFITAKYRARKKFFSQFAAFNERYLNELEFERRPLAQLLFSHEYTGDFGRGVEEYAKTRKKKAEWSYLTADERSLFEDYFTMLGRGDALSQKNYFKARATTLAEKKQSTEKEAKERTDLSVKLGLLAGLAVVILIV